MRPGALRPWAAPPLFLRFPSFYLPGTLGVGCFVFSFFSPVLAKSFLSQGGTSWEESGKLPSPPPSPCRFAGTSCSAETVLVPPSRFGGVLGLRRHPRHMRSSRVALEPGRRGQPRRKGPLAALHLAGGSAPAPGSWRLRPLPRAQLGRAHEPSCHRLLPSAAGTVLCIKPTQSDVRVGKRKCEMAL